jgi:hypothetical protein
MSKWKIIKGTYLKQDDKIDEMSDNGVKLGDTLYYCYRKKWGLFWKLTSILNQQGYDRLCENTDFDNINVRDIIKHINF